MRLLKALVSTLTLGLLVMSAMIALFLILAAVMCLSPFVWFMKSFEQNKFIPNLGGESVEFQGYEGASTNHAK